jgi:hypothetical protein
MLYLNYLSLDVFVHVGEILGQEATSCCAFVPIVAETRREFSAKTKAWRAISFAVSPWNSKTHSETDLHPRFTMFGSNVPLNSTRAYGWNRFGLGIKVDVPICKSPGMVQEGSWIIVTEGLESSC